MTPRQIDLIQNSFATLALDAERAGEIFYRNLFAIAPEVRPLFSDDMTVQQLKLLQTLAVVVDALPRLPTILPTVRELARRHVSYGTKDAHYAVVGRALIQMLHDVLGSALTPEAEAAWGEAYTVLSNEMIQASRQAA
jgi:hemoglobin-like flavoprotein